jgi:CheY-like chemotaxis protein
MYCRLEPVVNESSSILIVDDDPAVLRLFARILRRGGHPVLTANCGSRAIEILQSQQVRLVVLDIRMPSPDGFELLQVLRAQAPGLRVLAVSGYIGGALLDAATFLGATGTLNKADAPNQLLQKVNDLLMW